MKTIKVLATVGLSALALSALASPVYIAPKSAEENPATGDLQPAGGRTEYEKFQRANATQPGDLNGDGVIDAAESAINTSHANIKNLEAVDANNPQAANRLLPTVNKRTAAVTVRGWDPDKKAIIEARVKEVADKDENIASAEVDTDKVEIQYRRQAKLFGFIPVAYYHAFTVDGKGNISHGTPWWLALAKDDASTFGADVKYIFQHNQSDLRYIKMPTDIEQQTQRFNALINILKARHDASQQAVSNLK